MPVGLAAEDPSVNRFVTLASSLKITANVICSLFNQGKKTIQTIFSKMCPQRTVSILLTKSTICNVEKAKEKSKKMKIIEWGKIKRLTFLYIFIYRLLWRYKNLFCENVTKLRLREKVFLFSSVCIFALLTVLRKDFRVKFAFSRFLCMVQLQWNLHIMAMKRLVSKVSIFCLYKRFI